MVSRAAKRLLTSELQQGSLHNVATIIVCFLNCYLGLPAESSSEAAQEEPKKKSKKKRKGLSKTESLSLLLNKASVWSSIVEMICNNFCYEMKYASIEELCTTLHISKIVLLRRLCKTSGIQLIVREYNFTAQPTFSEGDIINILPVVKTAVIKPTDGGALFELASSQVNAGNLGNAQELATQSLGVYSQVFGPLHSDVANCYRLMSRMHFMAGESVPAMCFQHKAVMIFERVLGMDHPDTVAAYVNLALYCHHCEQTTVALRLMYRVRYLILLMFGQDTPELATCDSNIALMLHSCKEYELSLIFLEHALRLNLKYHGEGSIQVALNHHLIARGLTFTGDYRSALHHEKITYNIHKEKFGENHQRTKESAECLEQLTEKAVKMQKQINEITSHFPSSSRATAGGVDVPGQWSDVAMMSNSSKKPTKSTRTKKKSRSKIDGEHVKGTTQ